MAKNPFCVPPWWVMVLRRLTTASVVEMKAQATREVEEWKPLYRWLSALGSAPEGSVMVKLDQWLMEGWRLTALHLMKHVHKLRKYRRHEHALEDFFGNKKFMQQHLRIYVPSKKAFENLGSLLVAA